jgi:hypothetical protein
MIDRPAYRRHRVVLGASEIAFPPPAGRLIAHQHAVWRIHQVQIPAEFTGDDRQMWLDAGCPDPAELDRWTGWPYIVHAVWVAGERPSWAPATGPVVAKLRVPASPWGGKNTWHLYPESGRWPQCSCCGGPMPCRAELLDQRVAAGLAEVEKHTHKMPGCCWACTEPITHRQKAVTYEGDNLDMPTGPAVQFHTRQQCRPAACEYEERWLVLDPRRERILTWPTCGGILIVHADGTSQCVTGSDQLYVRDPNCRGHLTHDHTAFTTCTAGSHFARMTGVDDLGDCRRGCPPDSRHHTGTLTARPERRDRAELC